MADIDPLHCGYQRICRLTADLSPGPLTLADALHQTEEADPAAFSGDKGRFKLTQNVVECADHERLVVWTIMPCNGAYPPWVASEHDDRLMQAALVNFVAATKESLNDLLMNSKAVLDMCHDGEQLHDMVCGVRQRVIESLTPDPHQLRFVAIFPQVLCRSVAEKLGQALADLMESRDNTRTTYSASAEVVDAVLGEWLY